MIYYVIDGLIFWTYIFHEFFDRWFAKRFLHPDIVSIYDYIFLWDEDLGVEHFSPSRYEGCIFFTFLMLLLFWYLCAIHLGCKWLSFDRLAGTCNTGVNVMIKNPILLLHDMLFVSILKFDSWMKIESAFSAIQYKMCIILIRLLKLRCIRNLIDEWKLTLNSLTYNI